MQVEKVRKCGIYVVLSSVNEKMEVEVRRLINYRVWKFMRLFIIRLDKERK